MRRSAAAIRRPSRSDSAGCGPFLLRVMHILYIFYIYIYIMQPMPMDIYVQTPTHTQISHTRPWIFAYAVYIYKCHIHTVRSRYRRGRGRPHSAARRPHCRRSSVHRTLWPTAPPAPVDRYVNCNSHHYRILFMVSVKKLCVWRDTPSKSPKAGEILIKRLCVCCVSFHIYEWSGTF